MTKTMRLSNCDKINISGVVIITKNHYFHVGSTVAMQKEDSRPWMHEVIVEGKSTHHNWKLYTVRVTEMGRMITHNKKIHLEDKNNGRTVPQRADC